RERRALRGRGLERRPGALRRLAPSFRLAPLLTARAAPRISAGARHRSLPRPRGVRADREAGGDRDGCAARPGPRAGTRSCRATCRRRGRAPTRPGACPARAARASGESAARPSSDRGSTPPWPTPFGRWGRSIALLHVRENRAQYPAWSWIHDAYAVTY